MRRVVQLVSLLMLVTPGVMVAGSWTAEAASPTATKPGVLQQAWFWQTAYEQANPPVAAGPAPATEPSGVPKGDLGVAYTGDAGGASSKMSVVAFDVTGIRSGATVDDFTMSLTLDTSPSASNLNASAAPIVACLPTRIWSPADGGDYTDEPAVDCSNKVKPTVNGNTYTFKLATLAQSWIDDQNLGIALVNDPTNTQAPFQAVFTGGKTVAATMKYTPAAPTTPVTSTDTGASAPATAPAGATTVAAAPPPVPAAPAPINLPPTTTQSQPTGPAPQVAPGSVTPVLQPVLRAAKTASSMPTAPFWLAAIALALIVGAASLVLGDPAVPVASASQSRLDRVLRERRTVTTTSLTSSTPATAVLAPRGA